MNRRTFIKKSLGTTLAFLGLSGGTYYYSREIEPSLLKITNETITSPKIHKEFDRFKIIQFSDTHLGFHYSVEQLKKLADRINSLNPDLIVFTGDLLDEPNNFNEYNRVIPVLQSLKAPFGKFWVYGNHDHGGYGTDIVFDMMEEAQFTLLKNSSASIERNSARFNLAGIDDLILGKPDLPLTLQQAESDLFTILLAHEPDFADTAVQHPVDVQFSGHSHGGQVRFPFIGDLYTPVYAEKFVQGRYTLADGRLQLFVNSGIGTTRLPYRFLCKPELHVYTLHHQE